ncbi:molybdopterin converting factor subunit 1 [Siminovitchia terrae]|uniref:Molybdopterin synthase sulfur carrier subunit n=1 Tax=Siminovitchia terrae TaxID=1914933 RepID=A0A429XC44_SIMTE|nr:molybdopterin converting factor subunit 1 [Siminovitchia terrae]RST60929.1 molybdopterin converting factor subunit 1 [Siminovitchia terrae]
MNKIMLFAQLKEEVGKGAIEIEASGKTVGELRKFLEKETPLGNLDGIMIAVNEEFVKDDWIIEEKDDIALIPPVSGG